MSAILDFRRPAPAAKVRRGERSLIFDIENLLLDPTPGIQDSLRRAALEVCGRLPERAFCHWSLRTPPRDALAILLRGAGPGRAEQALDDAMGRFFRHYDRSGRFLSTLRPGALQMLKQLADDPRFELHYITHIGMHAAARLLDLHGLGACVRSIFTPEASSCPGMRPQLIRQVVMLGDRPPSHSVLLSDHPVELLTAQALHLRSIALGYGRAPLPTLLQLDPDGIACDLVDVGAHLRALLLPRPAMTLPPASQYLN